MESKKAKREKSAYQAVVPAVEQASRILLCLARNAPSRINLTDICNKVGIHKSKGYTILNTLQRFGFVQREADGKLYSLGPGLIPLGRKVLDSLNYKDVAEPFLGDLAQETGSSAFFGLISGESVFVVGKQEGNGDIGITIRQGQRYPITHGAHGKAIVAHLPELERQRVLAGGKLFFHGEPARLDRLRLEGELVRCRQEGYAVDLGESNPQINAVASPVFASSERLIGVLFVVGLFPKSKVRQYGRKVVEAAQGVSALLGADGEELYGSLSRKRGSEFSIRSSEVK
ncbi:MAG: IclR family transcriptional regulator [Deltaproteobacteria bacterium]|nr:IclR family transcriptional regulator [Deltaproteobacteria bacterium]